MATDFIETMQKLEDVTGLLNKIGLATFEQAVEHIKIITAYIDRYGDLGKVFEHFKALESKLYMCRDILTVDEAAEYLGVSKSKIYLMTSGREITHYKPSGKAIYFERKELDDLCRRNIVPSNRALESRAAGTTWNARNRKGRKEDGK